MIISSHEGESATHSHYLTSLIEFSANKLTSRTFVTKVARKICLVGIYRAPWAPGTLYRALGH